MFPHELPSHQLFQVREEFLTPEERVNLSYRRARLVLRTHGQLFSRLDFTPVC